MVMQSTVISVLSSFIGELYQKRYYAQTAKKLGKRIQELHLEGMKPSQIAKELNIGVASVYRYR